MRFHSNDNDTYLSILGTGVMLKATLGILVCEDSFIHHTSSSRASGLQGIQLISAAGHLEGWSASGDLSPVLPWALSRARQPLSQAAAKALVVSGLTR